jgi:hypothetical protein
MSAFVSFSIVYRYTLSDPVDLERRQNPVPESTQGEPDIMKPHALIPS